jgi:hypothetical protein
VHELLEDVPVSVPAVAVIEAKIVSVSPEPRPGARGVELIDVGRDWAVRRGVRIGDTGLLLEIGYTVAMVGDNVDLLIRVYELLGVPFKAGVNMKTGRRTVVRIEPKAETGHPAVTQPDVTSAIEKKKRKLDSRLDLRLPSDERTELEQWAKRKGQSLGQYARELLAQGVWYDKAPVLEKQERDLREESA